MTLHFSICSKCSLRTLSSCVWRRRLILSLILFSYLLTATRFLVLRADNIYLSLIGPDRTSNLASKQTSGVTGTLFNGEKTRLYKGNICFGTENNVCSNSALLNPRNTTRRSSRRWGVCTTINRIGDAIKAILQIPDWKVVVVADQKTPEYPIHRDMVFLSVAEQMALRNQFKDFIDLIPWNHFGRKNIGYLYAIINGAEMIFDFDDDNILKQKFIMNPSMPKEFHRINIASSCDQTTNAYKFMGAPKSNVDAWPRGFPLNLIRNECREELLKSSMSMMDDKIAIYQSLADHEPDVDAIFRLTRTVPFNFDPLNDKSIEFPEGIYTPFNAQATFFLPSAFWSMLLPITVRIITFVSLLKKFFPILIALIITLSCEGPWKSFGYMAIVHCTNYTMEIEQDCRNDSPCCNPVQKCTRIFG